MRGWGLARRALLRHLLVRPEGVSELGLPAPGNEPAAATHATLPQWLAAHPGQRVFVALSGRWVHPLLSRQEALVNARVHDQLAWAQQQFLHFHGHVAATWPVALWCQAPMLAALALHGVDLPLWQAAAAEHGCHLLSVQPWWAGLPDTLQATDPARRWPGTGSAGLLAVEGLPADSGGGMHSTWMGFEQGRLSVLEQRRASGPGAQALAELLHGWQHSHGVPAQATAVMAFGLHPDTARACRLALQDQLVGDPGSALPPLSWVAH